MCFQAGQVLNCLFMALFWSVHACSWVRLNKVDSVLPMYDEQQAGHEKWLITFESLRTGVLSLFDKKKDSLVVWNWILKTIFLSFLRSLKIRFLVQWTTTSASFLKNERNMLSWTDCMSCSSSWSSGVGGSTLWLTILFTIHRGNPLYDAKGFTSVSLFGVQAILWFHFVKLSKLTN